MKITFLFIMSVCILTAGIISADTFGTGNDQFEIEFVPISGDTSPTSGFGIVNYDYRIGTYEISNAMWNKFINQNGVINGDPIRAYDKNPFFATSNVPTNNTSWYEAAQFVNWLNTSTGHQPAYKFNGIQGTSDYTLDVWSVTQAAGGVNLYRHKDAKYFLPSGDEWVKAAFWNGENLQTWSTVGDVPPTQDGWNFFDSDYATNPMGPWDITNGIEELNGTFNMMGNIGEWTESPFENGNYASDATRNVIPSSFIEHKDGLRYVRAIAPPSMEMSQIGFRVASIPEPATLSLLALGSLAMLRRRK